MITFDLNTRLSDEKLNFVKENFKTEVKREEYFNVDLDVETTTLTPARELSDYNVRYVKIKVDGEGRESVTIDFNKPFYDIIRRIDGNTINIRGGLKFESLQQAIRFLKIGSLDDALNNFGYTRIDEE